MPFKNPFLTFFRVFYTNGKVSVTISDAFRKYRTDGTLALLLSDLLQVYYSNGTTVSVELADAFKKFRSDGTLVMQVANALEIFQSDGLTRALRLRGGTNAYGIGKAVSQFYTGRVEELAPGEITANAEDLGGGKTSLSLELSSPSQSTGYANSKTHALLKLSAEDNIPMFGGVSDIARLYVNSFYVLSPDSTAVPNEDTFTRVGRLAGPGILGTAIQYLRLYDNVQFENSPPDFYTVDTTVTFAAGFTQRAGAFVSTVQKIGNDHLFFQLHATNSSGAAMASGVTLVTGGTMPSWAVSPSGEVQYFPVVGTGIGATAGAAPYAELDSSGRIRLFGLAIPNGANIAVTGMCKSAAYWTP